MPASFLRAASLGIAGTLLWTAACTTDSLSPDPCTGPAVIVTPDPVSFAVGDTVLMVAQLVGPPQCRPTMMTLRTLRWRTDDTLVARVSPNKGYLVAKGAGVTNVITYYQGDESVWSTIPVTVAPE